MHNIHIPQGTNMFWELRQQNCPQPVKLLFGLRIAQNLCTRTDMHNFFAWAGDDMIPVVEQVCREDLAIEVLKLHNAIQLQKRKKHLEMASGYLWQAQQAMHCIAEFYDDFEQAMLAEYIKEKLNENL